MQDGSEAMRLFQTYFDSSGRPEDHDGVIVAGCVSSVDQWQRLEPDWNRILAEEGVGVVNGYRALHMKDLTSGRRAFRGWSEKERSRLLRRLALLIRVRVRFIFGVGVPMSAYEASQRVLTNRAGWAPSPLTFCAASCVQEVGGWCIRNAVDGERMLYTFESGDPNKGEIDRLMSDIARTTRKRSDFRLAGWDFGGKDLVGLQVADWVSYETFVWGDRHVLPQYGEGTTSNRPVRRSLVELSRVDNRIGYYGDTEDVLGEVRSRMDVWVRDHGPLPS